VVRFSPNLAAAPRGPPTTQPTRSSVSMIKERSESMLSGGHYLGSPSV
jgi:hypothetical protein